MKLMKQIRRRDYLLRHATNFAPYLTLRKVVNLLINFLEKKLRIPLPISCPIYIKVEPTPLCQLRCPGCMQSTEDFKKQFNKNMQISLGDFRAIIDPLVDSLLGISLSNHGEPLLHNEITSLIDYAHKKNVAVSFPTNLSLKLDKSLIVRLVHSGLDSMYVSLDGATEETYNIYRVGGNFELILRNVRSIADAKNEYGLKRPKLVWKFVVFGHNRHEIDIVRKRYKELGFDDYEFVPDIRSKERKLEMQNYKANLRKSREGCFWLWHAMIIRWDGKVFPCCTKQSFNLGNAINRNTLEIWRSEEYRKLREGFSDKDNHRCMNPICRECMGYESALPPLIESGSQKKGPE